MNIKWDVQGLFIYLSLAGYLAAFILVWIQRKTFAAQFCFLFAFLSAATAYIMRWMLFSHLPMQNLFEIFLLMGLLIWPISLLSRYLLKDDSWQTAAGDALIGVLVMIPTGFVFSAAPRPLPPALQCVLFGPHVASYMIAYILMARACVPAVTGLICFHGGQRLINNERLCYGMTAAAFPLLSLGLILGSVWGKLAWGDWWGWDPKELWSLACWLVYIFYFHWRIVHPKQYMRTRLFLVLIGVFFIIITLLWVNLSRLFAGMHNYAM
jgi:ABC-type transport system involved in cytochrome c biogenesis permease subunit